MKQISYNTILQSIFENYMLFSLSHKRYMSYTYLKHHLNHLKLSPKTIYENL